MMLIENALVITMNSALEIIKDGAIVIDGNRIVAVGRTADLARRDDIGEVIDATRKLVIPGLIDAHVHLLHCLVRGLCADMDLLDYIKMCSGPNYSTINEEEAYVASMLGCIESIKSGTTCLIDNSIAASQRWRAVIDQLLAGVADSGLRAIGAPSYIDLDSGQRKQSAGMVKTTEQVLSDYEWLFEKWHQKLDGRIKIWGSPNNLLYCTTESLVQVAELAHSYGAGIHTHTLESRSQNRLLEERFGKSYVEVFEELGVLNEKFHVVHGVWLTESDIKLLKKSGAKVIHNPESNMILSSGIAPVTKLLENNVVVGLGCDACICNNNLDMIETMRFAALLQKVHTLRPDSLTAMQVLRMATIGGATALGMEEEIGSIEVGKKADLAIIDCDQPNMVPMHDPVANLVYSSNAGNVDTVIVDGKVLMRNRVLTFIDEQQFLNTCRDKAVTLMSRFP
jgi:cytosine/adenosine deaminase-related metal-dependent hydrolase